jgi:hypothetical protein
VTTGRTPQQTLAAMYDEGAAAYEKYWAPMLHRHALDWSTRCPLRRLLRRASWWTWPPVPAPLCRHCEALPAAVDESSLLTAVTGCFVAYHHRCPGCRPTPQHCHFVRRPHTS